MLCVVIQIDFELGHFLLYELEPSFLWLVGKMLTAVILSGFGNKRRESVEIVLCLQELFVQCFSEFVFVFLAVALLHAQEF